MLNFAKKIDVDFIGKELKNGISLPPYSVVKMLFIDIKRVIICTALKTTTASVESDSISVILIVISAIIAIKIARSGSIARNSTSFFDILCFSPS